MGRSRPLITQTVSVEATVEQIAELFWSLDDEEQCLFFELVQEKADSEDLSGMQWLGVGKRMTDTNNIQRFGRARHMLRDLANWLDKHAGRTTLEQFKYDSLEG